ncbi:MAG TPA: thymidylate kinase [Sneathiellales bacterium]|nr:thymidylate kinase [Sneathiellales bacterium]
MTSQREFAPLIALIGCDGSGKSTVGEEVLTWTRGYGPAELVHLGKQSGNVARALGKLPLLGKHLNKTIDSRSDSHRELRDKKTPGIIAALVITAFLLRRLNRFRLMLALRRRGRIIVADRFPQLEIPGVCDGPGLSVTAPGNAMMRWLAGRERAAYGWMIGYRPDLVLRLNVDLDTAFARKPDHSRVSLARKVEGFPLLKYNGAPIVELDASQPLDDVVAAAKEAVSRTLTERGYSLHSP